MTFYLMINWTFIAATDFSIQVDYCFSLTLHVLGIFLKPNLILNNLVYLIV